MRWTMGSRYARVLPEPVSAWMKASESSTSSCVIAAFWMAVGALRESFVRRWVARVGERPREVKVSRSEDRGALEGVGGGMSLERGSFVGAAVVGGLEEKREETISLGGLFEFCLGRDVVRSSSFGLLTGRMPLVSGSLATVRTALLPVKGPDVWIRW